MYVTRANTWCGEVDTEDFSTAKTREVYLPDGTKWIDFWTGETLDGGQTVEREVPIDVIPLYVRAGSIVPWGPEVQYATEKRWDNLEIRVYPGADGEFVLYEDENDNYNYEKGLYSTIRFTWDDARRRLTIADRAGTFPGMLKSRAFRVVVVAPGRGAGGEASTGADRVVSYKGKAITVKL
jgi:alpha-D-xyloside xylohydrolase